MRDHSTLEPTGTRVFVFTDIENSTPLTEKHGADFEIARAEHFARLRRAADAHGGEQVKNTGDGLLLVFDRAADAIGFAVAAQRALGEDGWPETVGALKVRIGAHAGDAFFTGDDYNGPAVNRAARVMSAGHGGQIVVSEAVRALTPRLPAGITFQDLGRHRLKGIGEDRLWQVCAPDLPTEFSPPATLAPGRHNLPLASADFLGRDEETAELTALLLSGKPRLLTLSGFGGMGKTSMARQIAEASLDGFPGGVWWVDAAESRSADALLQRIAFDLGLDMPPPPPARERIRAFLNGRGKILLVLDNVEQTEGGPDLVQGLLAACNDLTLLVTSRRPLRLRAEIVREIRPLPPADACRLFVLRARAVCDDFAIDAETAADIETLCRHLDGIPLAVELAAARAATLAPRQMLARLSERFRLLQSRAVDLPERQRALRAAIDWSYDLLDDEDRAVFAQLSVFAGGFTLDDAEAVCDAFDTLESVETLRLHSFLLSETHPATREVRLRLLEALREYAAERLDSTATIALGCRERHARRFLALAEVSLAKLRTEAEAEALRALETILDNLRVACDYAESGEMFDEAARLRYSLGLLLARRGFAAEAATPIEAGIRSARRAGNPPTLIRLLLERAGLFLDQQETEAAQRTAAEACALAISIADTASEADAENLLGQAAAAQLDFPAARRHYARAEALREALGDPRGLAIVRNNRAIVEMDAPDGDFPLAEALLSEALEVRRAAGDLRGLATTRNNLGYLAYCRSDWPSSERHFREAARIERELGHLYGLARALNNVGEVREEQGDPDAAARLYAAAVHLFTEVGHPNAGYSQERLDALGLSADVRAALQRATGRPVAELFDWALSGNASKT